MNSNLVTGSREVVKYFESNLSGLDASLTFELGQGEQRGGGGEVYGCGGVWGGVH